MGVLWLHEWPCLGYLLEGCTGRTAGYALVDESMPELEVRQSAHRVEDLRAPADGESVYEVRT